MEDIHKSIFDLEFENVKIQSHNDADMEEIIRQLITKQSFGVLCTQGESQPYGSIIGFAFTDDLKTIYFSTAIDTRKYQLLNRSQRVAFVIDNRCEHPNEMTKIESVTVTGKAKRIESGEDFELGNNLLKNRLPYFQNFIDKTSAALFRIKVVRYFYVTRFQGVAQWIP